MRESQAPSLTWQQQLKDTVNNVSELCEYLELDIHSLALNCNPQFPVRVPRYYLDKITKQNPVDPLLLQVLPQQQELISHPNYCQDPLQEAKYLKAPGLIHKYFNRVLLTLTGACGIHCRYCFRQYFPYNENLVAQHNRKLQLDYIRSNPHITEIILSGGDPLCVSNKYLENLITEISTIPHITTIRFHSRMPIVIPDRIDSDFINLLQNYQELNFVLVTHCNHAQELDNVIAKKMALLMMNKVTVLNQSVLLANINDSSSILRDLSNKLFHCNILPYYLHVLDPVRGTSHFNLNCIVAKNILHELRTLLPGYLVPRLVQENPGELSKTPIL